MPNSATPLGDLRAEAQSVLRRLCRLVHTNKERLVGMVAQFDEGDKGYLNKIELVREGRTAQWVDVVPTWLADNEGKAMRAKGSAKKLGGMNGRVSLLTRGQGCIPADQPARRQGSYTDLPLIPPGGYRCVGMASAGTTLFPSNSTSPTGDCIDFLTSTFILQLIPDT